MRALVKLDAQPRARRHARRRHRRRPARRSRRRAALQRVRAQAGQDGRRLLARVLSVSDRLGDQRRPPPIANIRQRRRDTRRAVRRAGARPPGPLSTWTGPGRAPSTWTGAPPSKRFCVLRTSRSSSWLGQARGLCRARRGSVLDQVRHDQRGREKEQAEDEVADEAVALAARTGRAKNARATQRTTRRIQPIVVIAMTGTMTNLRPGMGHRSFTPAWPNRITPTR